MMKMLQDPMNLYAVAFVLFLALAFIFGRKPATGWLDGEIEKIRAELDTARQLRAEAEATLADCKTKQARAESEARMILEMAQREAQAMRKRAEDDLTASLARHEQLTSERISQAHSEAMEIVRTTAIDAAMEMARKMLTSNMSEADAARLVDQAISEVSSLKVAKSKAA